MIRSRRNILKAGLTGLGGVVGVVVAGRPTSAGAQPVDGAATGALPGETLSLYGRNWQVSASRSVGRLPEPGDRLTVSGILTAEPGGPAIGEFHGVLTALRNPGGGGLGAVATLEQHMFVLEGGTLLGSGGGSQALDQPDTFVIVGGTGRYAGAGGSYVARQGHVDFGGDGTADFVLTILPSP